MGLPSRAKAKRPDVDCDGLLRPSLSRGVERSRIEAGAECSMSGVPCRLALRPALALRYRGMGGRHAMVVEVRAFAGRVGVQ